MVSKVVLPAKLESGHLPDFCLLSHWVCGIPDRGAEGAYSPARLIGIIDNA